MSDVFPEIFPVDHMSVQHEYASGSWQDFTGDLVSASIILREFAGTHTATLSFYNAAMDPSQGSGTTVIKKGDTVVIYMNNGSGVSRKTATFTVRNVAVAIDLTQQVGRQNKITATLIGKGVAGVGGSA